MAKKKPTDLYATRDVIMGDQINNFINSTATTSKSLADLINTLQQYQIEPWIQSLALQPLNDPQTTLDFVNALDQAKKIVLVGNSGSGKTQTLKMVANELNQGKSRPCLFVPLIYYSSNLSHTIKVLLRWHDVPDDQVILELEKNNVVILLDGLNEVTKEQDQCIREIRLLLDTYQGHLCVSYPKTDLSYFGFEIPTYTISTLSDNQIEQAIRTFFSTHGKPNKADWLLHLIRAWNDKEQTEFYALAQTPIHLQHLLELAEADDFEYSSLHDLYGQVIQKRLAHAKRHDQLGQFPIEIKLEFLLKLAYVSIVQDQPFLMQKDFVMMILSETFELAKASLLMEEIKRAGLLLEYNDFLLEWPHTSFRDYLAGRQLFKLIETDKPFGDFPIETLRGVNAAAHATRLLTTQSRRLENRATVFLALLKKSPKLQILKVVAEEYYPAIEYYQSMQMDLNCDEDQFTKLNWGERFLSTYHLIESVTRENGILSAEQKIPFPIGLSVYFDTNSSFCLILFSGSKEIRFEHFDDLSVRIDNHKKKKQPTFGFCLPTPFLLLLDPEMVAYLQVGIWLKVMLQKKDEVLSKWHNNLSTYITPPMEWLPWSQLDTLPETNEICANPQETNKFLIEHYGPQKFEQIAQMTDIVVHSKRILLSWNEIYMPVTFHIEPTKTQDRLHLVSNRLSQVMVQKLPDHHISLLLLMPLTSQFREVTLGAQIFVPSHVRLLHRYYFLFKANSTLGTTHDLSFVHLRG